MIKHTYKGITFMIDESTPSRNGWRQYATDYKGKILWMNARKLSTFINAIEIYVNGYLEMEAINNRGGFTK